MNKLPTYYVEELDCEKRPTNTHTVQIIKVQDLLDHIEKSAEQGNMKPDRGFSAGLYLSQIIMELHK